HRGSGWWKDTGRLEDLLEANRLLLGAVEPRVEGEVDGASHLLGPVVVERGAKVIRSGIRGPAIIGEGTVVEDSLVGPYTSIYYGCTVTGSEIEDSIVMEQCRIEEVEGMAASILGKAVEVGKGKKRPAAYRLIVG